MIVRARFRGPEEAPGAPTGEMSSAESAGEARLLALAYVIEIAVEDGRDRSVAEVARALGLSRARLSQVMRRRWAAAEEQEPVILPGGG